MPSKLTIHNNTITDANALRDWILTARPTLVKTLHHDAGFWREIKAEMPELYLLGRDYADLQPLGNRPEIDAEAKGRHILDNSTAHLFDGWEGYNEKDTYSGMNLPRQCAFDRRLGQIMRSEGLDYWAGSYSVGHPGVWLEAENRWLWEKPEFLDMLREPGVTGIAIHEYYAPRMDDPRNYDPLMPGTGWWLFRYRKWHPSLPPDCQKPLVISEYGIDSGAPHFDPGAQGGWRSFTLAGDYMEQLADMDRELQRDEYVRAACIYCAWVADPTWRTFDISGEVADLLRDHIIVQRDPEPEPEPVPDDELHKQCYNALTATQGFLGTVENSMTATVGQIEGVREELQVIIETLAAPSIPFWAYIISMAAEYDLDPYLVAGVIKAESNFDPEAIGDGGNARGLGQMWPMAWVDAWGGVPDAPGYDEVFDPEYNIEAICRYLVRYRAWLEMSYHVSSVKYLLACYNWGPGAVSRHLAAGRTWEQVPAEVRLHVQRYLDAMEGLQPQ